MQNHRLFGTSQMGLSYPSSYGLRNPFSPTNLPPQNETNVAALYTDHLLPGRASGSSDYQRMLHQHLSTTEGIGSASIQQHSILDDQPPLTHHIYDRPPPMRGNVSSAINDSHMGGRTSSAAAGIGANVTASNYYTRNSQSILSDSMGASVRTGVRKLEGPSTGSNEGGILNTLYNSTDAIANGVHPNDITTVDMCLSTLYIYNLHDRKVRRHIDQQQQQQSGSASQHLSSSGPAHHSGSLPSSAVEKTPLLGAKKS